MMEVACNNGVGFYKIPIVLINVDGFYDGIIMQVERAAKDKMLYATPDDTLHVEAGVAGALKWCEAKVTALEKEGKGSDSVVLQARNTTFIFRKRHSFLVGLAVGALGAILTVGEAALLTKWLKKRGGRE